MVIWLHTEWTMSTDKPNKAVEEEKATYLRIMENLVTVVVAADLAKRNEIGSIGSAAESVQLDAADEKETEKGGKEARVARKGWVLDAERLIRTATAGAGKSKVDASSLSPCPAVFYGLHRTLAHQQIRQGSRS
jgi:hypothetical protein